MLLEGRIDHLTATQLVEVRQTLARAARDLGRARLRLTMIARSSKLNTLQIDIRLRHFREANESVTFLGGLRTIRERITQIDQELLRRLLIIRSQA